MGFLTRLFFPWGLILQAVAIVHFIRRRPDTYWIWIILFLGPIGALVYIFAEVVPDYQILNQSFKGISRGNRVRALQLIIRDNPSVGNYEELGELLMESGNFQAARAAFDKAIDGHIDIADAYYRRGICSLQLGDAAAAVRDIEPVVAKDPDFNFHRAAGLLAHAYALNRQPEKAEALFRRTLATSTLSETYLDFASLLASLGKNAEAREWAQKVLDKKPTMPGYLRRRERPWFQRANKLLRRLPA
jgi:hypothetical protein